jgi:hypothetical protein
MMMMMPATSNLFSPSLLPRDDEYESTDKLAKDEKTPSISILSCGAGTNPVALASSNLKTDAPSCLPRFSRATHTTCFLQIVNFAKQSRNEERFSNRSVIGSAR